MFKKKETKQNIDINNILEEDNTKKGKKDKKDKKDKKKNKSKQQTAQSTIPIKTIYEDGIFEVETGVYTKTYPMYDANFQICSTDEQTNIFNLYCELLNSIDNDVTFEVTINNRNIDIELFKQQTLIAYRGDSADEYRTEMNQLLQDKLLQGRNNIKREKYLTVSLKASSHDEAAAEFVRMDAKICKAIKDIVNINITPLTSMERLSILYDIMNLDSLIPFNTRIKNTDNVDINSISFDNLKKQGLTPKDAIAPSCFVFNKDSFEMGNKVACVLFMKNLPSFLKSDVLIDISDAPYNMLTSVHYSSMPMVEAVKLIKHQIVNINADVIAAQKRAFKNKYSPELISVELQKAQAEATALLADVTGRNQKLFYVDLTVMVMANDMEELDFVVKDIKNRVSKHLFTLEELSCQQENGFATVLPLANNKVHLKRLLTSESASIFIPYAVKEYTAKNGFYYGLNAVSKNMILYNRKNAKNANGFILGTPGSGKSFAAKMEIINAILSTNDDVFIIDPDREYRPLMEILGGETIKISLGGDNYINPFDMSMVSDNKNPLALKSDFIQALCETIAGGKFGLSASQISIIDRCVTLVYQPYMEMMARRHEPNFEFDQSLVPTFEDFYELLLAQPQQEAKMLAVAIENYAVGNQDLFSHHTNVDTSSRLITYDLKDIGSNKMKELGVQICLNDIWNRITENRAKGKYTWFFIDEFYLLTQNESSAKFLQQIFKRARKYGGIPTGITQNVEDILAQPQARTMLSNSDFVMMLKQAALDRVQLAELLHISPTQLSYITNSSQGQGLIYTGDNIVPFINQFPTDTKLYKAMTTSFSEKSEEQQKKEILDEEE